MWVPEEPNGKLMVSPPQRVLAVKDYQGGHGHPFMVSVEKPRRIRQKEVHEIQRKDRRLAAYLRGVSWAGAIRDPELIYSLGQLWPAIPPAGN